MPHEILYQLGFGGDEAFHTFTLLWEPHTNKVSLRFRNKREAANGIVSTVPEMLAYLDSRALTGYPWDTEVPRAARRRLAELLGAAAPPDPLAEDDPTGEQLRAG